MTTSNNSNKPNRKRVPVHQKERNSLASARRQLWIGIAASALTVTAVVVILIILTWKPQQTSAPPQQQPTVTPLSRTLAFSNGEETPSPKSKIIIRSDMDGTEIWLNNIFKGITPLVIKNPEPGIYNGRAVIKHPPMERTFKIVIDAHPPQTVTHDITFKGGSPIPAVRSTAPPRSIEKKIRVDYPKEVAFKKYYSILVRPVPGVTFTNGMVYILPKCLAGKVNLKDAPSYRMFPYRGGLIRENLKPEWCRGPGQDKENGVYFYIKLMTSDGPITAGTPEHPFSIEFVR